MRRYCARAASIGRCMWGFQMHPRVGTSHNFNLHACRMRARSRSRRPTLSTSSTRRCAGTLGPRLWVFFGRQRCAQCLLIARRRCCDEGTWTQRWRARRSKSRRPCCSSTTHSRGGGHSSEVLLLLIYIQNIELCVGPRVQFGHDLLTFVVYICHSARTRARAHACIRILNHYCIN